MLVNHIFVAMKNIVMQSADTHMYVHATDLHWVSAVDWNLITLNLGLTRTPRFGQTCIIRLSEDYGVYINVIGVLVREFGERSERGGADSTGPRRRPHQPPAQVAGGRRRLCHARVRALRSLSLPRKFIYTNWILRHRLCRILFI